MSARLLALTATLAACVNPMVPGSAQPCRTDAGQSCDASGVEVISFQVAVLNDCRQSPSGDVSVVAGTLVLLNHSKSIVQFKIPRGIFVSFPAGTMLAQFDVMTEGSLAPGESRTLVLRNQPGSLFPTSSCTALPCGDLTAIVMTVDLGGFASINATSQSFRLPCSEYGPDGAVAMDLTGGAPDLSMVPCSSDPTCGHGSICSNGFCVAGGCSRDWVCPGGSAYACCAPGGGSMGTCTDIQNDINNCGVCGSACPSIGGTPSCAGGFCFIVCNGGFGDCDGNLLNGCETNLITSSAHCGACKTACAAGTTCLGGICK